MNTTFSVVKPPANFWSRSWPYVSQLIINGLVKSSLVVLSYFLIKILTQQVKLNQAISGESILLLLAVALGVMGLRVHERYIAEKMSQNYINRVRSGLLKRIMRASIRNIQSQTVGNLSSRLAGDLNALKRWLSLGISRIITHSLLLIVTLSLIASINLYLGLLLTLSIMTLLYASTVLGNHLKLSIKKVRRNRIMINSLLVERLSSIETIRAMGKEQLEVKKITRQARKLEKNIAKQGLFLGFLRGIGEAASVLLISVFFIFQLFTQNVLQVEEMTALISTILFLNTPIRELGRVQEYYQGAKLSLEKLSQLYAIPRIVRGQSKQLSSGNPSLENLGKIKIKALKLNGVFNDFKADAMPGEHIAVIGENGTGKSTLFQLILGHIKADSGSITVNGVNPQNYSPQLRSENIGVSGVNHKIIKTTLLDNLSYRYKHFESAEFTELLTFCQLKTFIKNLPDGLNTQVKENGSNFSSGENARIGLFRALLGNPQLLILDEPESYLDGQGLALIKILLKTYTGTILLATHNEELISLCAKSWNLNKKNKPAKLYISETTLSAVAI